MNQTNILEKKGFMNNNLIKNFVFELIEAEIRILFFKQKNYTKSPNQISEYRLIFFV